MPRNTILKYLLIIRAVLASIFVQAGLDIQSAEHHVHYKADHPRHVASLSRNSDDSMENPTDVIAIVGVITTSFTHDTVHTSLL